jgi:hypothetical protein
MSIMIEKVVFKRERVSKRAMKRKRKRKDENFRGRFLSHFCRRLKTTPPPNVNEGKREITG